MANDIRSRKGIIKISKAVFGIGDFRYLTTLFSIFIPVHIHNNEMDNYLEYYGYCEQFETTREGEPYNNYEAIFTVNENENETTLTEFKKI